MLVVPGAAGGEFLGGLVTRLLRLKVKGMLRMCALLSLIVGLFAILLVVIGCESPPLAGVNVQYFNRCVIIVAGLSAGTIGLSCLSVCVHDQ